MNKTTTNQVSVTSRVHLLTQMAFLTALMMVMAFTPLGYIPLPFMNATTMHIPVIIGACLLGPKTGALLGGIFGITSVVKATIQPNLTSFVFTPFYSFSPQFHGGIESLIVAIVPRILIGLIAGFLFQFLKKKKKNLSFSLLVSGFVGSMVNTAGVMTLIYLLFGEQYAMAGGTDPSMLFGVIMGVVGLNGIPEALIAAILTQAVGRALFVVKNHSGRNVTSAV
ncbi:MAG: ECF transporter S component [Lachnospiraceae bacterium]